MQIVKLVSQNIKRLSAISIEPGAAPLVVVGGRNRAGKSSVLDSIAYALGGKDLIPAEPIRAGEAEARITADLGDLVVTRVFRRDRLPCDCGVTNSGDMPIRGDDEMHLQKCAWHRFGETRSALTVKSKDGATYPSPQSMLDKLIGKLSFDPLAFATQAKDDPKRAAETLRQLVGLDLEPLDIARKTAFEERTAASKALRTLEGAMATLPRHEGVPDAELGDEAVQRELEGAEELRREATEAGRVYDIARADLESYAVAVKHWADKVAVLETQLGEAREQMFAAARWVDENRERVDALQAQHRAARARVPDVASVRNRLAEIGATNQRVRDNQRYEEKAQQAAALAERIDALHARIQEIDAQRAAAIAAARWPVPGLGWTPEGVTLNGVPFEQASSSEQLRAGVAIGLALNPKLQVLLVRNGNLLDEDGVRALAEQAEAAGAQVWMEYVTSGSDGVTVLIEDGHVG
jgi:hypothetical protein